MVEVGTPDKRASQMLTFNIIDIKDGQTMKASSVSQVVGSGQGNCRYPVLYVPGVSAHRRLVVAVISSLLMLGFCCVPGALAIPIVDQSFPDSSFPDTGAISPGNVGSNIGKPGSYDLESAQTFTVGVSGLLTRLDVGIRSSLYQSTGSGVDLLIDFRPTLDGVPIWDDSSALSSFVLSTEDFLDDQQSRIHSIDLTSVGLYVTAGEQLAIVMRAPGSTGTLDMYSWQGYYSDPNHVYEGGSRYSRNLQLAYMGWKETPEMDLIFRTWVNSDTDPVPEPATMLLLGTGLIGLAGTRRKMKL